MARRRARQGRSRTAMDGLFGEDGFHRVPGDGDVPAEKAWELDPLGRWPDRVDRAHIEVEAKQ